MKPQLMTIVQELKKRLVRQFKDEINQVILFGSRSRDDAGTDSDYDILLVLNHDYDWRKENTILRACYEIDLQYNVLTDVKIISVNELQSIKGKQPFIINAMKEGIRA